MAGTKPKIRFTKVIEMLLWLAGLGVLAENIFDRTQVYRFRLS
jgi:hypothetical protein